MSTQLDIMLEKEMINNKLESWNKLNKSCKLLKLQQYANDFGQSQKYSVDQITELYLFLVSSMSRGNLSKVKNIIYNKTTNSITSIPGLIYVTDEPKYFMIVSSDKDKASTLTYKKNIVK